MQQGYGGLVMTKKCSDFGHCLYFTANSLTRMINKMADEEFKKLGLCTSHAFLLMVVMEKPGINQKDLAKLLNLNQSTVSRFVDTLAAKGYLKKIMQGKKSCAHPTEAAKVLADTVKSAWENFYAKYSEVLGEEGGRQLAENIYEAYKKLGPQD